MLDQNRSEPSGSVLSADSVVRISGARVHNLKNVQIEIPRDQLVVITGPSGSGKSSLAFDTLYAEGQRQYVESLSVYARQFLDQMERPDVDLIEGLQPTICIDQRGGSHNPRSTVATVTEVYDYLRLLFARLGESRCYNCGEPIRQMSTEQIQESLIEMQEGTKAMILAPLVRGRKGKHQDALDEVRKAGFVRVRVNGQVYEVDQVPELAPRKMHHIEAVIDRVIVRPGIETRLAESVDLALINGEGLVILTVLAPDAKDTRDPKLWHDELYSTKNACPSCKLSFDEIEPRSFSFNSPYGACQACEGLGIREEFDPDLIIPDWSLSLDDGALVPWKNGNNGTKKHKKELIDFVKLSGVSWDAPLEQWKPKAREQLLRGTGKKFLGVLTLLEKEYVTSTRAADRQRLEAFRGEVTCVDCEGSRLRPEARACRLGELAIHQVTAMTVSEARTFFEELKFHEEDWQIAEPITSEIVKRLEFLEKVGVEYLTLDRSADTLSGGESQRVRLATGIGSGLVGVCYILDEPSIGLHPRDNQRLIDALRELQEQGNTVIVVEHDEAMMRQADHLIDMGPGAGRHGGEIVSQGTPASVEADPESVTGRYLQGQLSIEVPTKRRRIAKTRSIHLEGAATNNLKQVSVSFPLGALICVTGVSGSGKSSLVNATLARALGRRLGLSRPKPGSHSSLRGASQVDRLVEIDQSPIGRTPRSNPATYTGIFDEVRKVFAGTRGAKQRGYKVGRFSFNVKGGRCEVCQGQGLQKIEMNFLPNLYVTCPECDGKRFNRQTLQILYRDRSIADVLDTRIDDSLEFFENFPVIHRLLASLHDVGLGYLTLGQPSTTLSGGEAQRVKLATELGRTDTGSTMYILDEPTTGLHFDDIRRLLAVLQKLVDQGNTVLVIEHNLDVIKTADWIIDMGPEGGAAGGEVVFTGRPEEIATLDDNHTGRFLKPLLGTSR